MNKTVEPRTLNEKLAIEWNKVLHTLLHSPDQAVVTADESDNQTLRVHITSAGHTQFSFDFKVTYADDREVAVELVDVQEGDRTIDERTERIQQLIEDYVRHIHECAQAMQNITHQ